MDFTGKLIRDWKFGLHIDEYFKSQNLTLSPIVLLANVTVTKCVNLAKTLPTHTVQNVSSEKVTIVLIFSAGYPNIPSAHKSQSNPSNKTRR